MDRLAGAGEIRDIDGQPNTNVGNMLTRIRTSMADVAESENHEVRITDILAVDTLAPVEISGALAGETCMEKAVGIAAMVKQRIFQCRRSQSSWNRNFTSEQLLPV